MTIEENVNNIERRHEEYVPKSSTAYTVLKYVAAFSAALAPPVLAIIVARGCSDASKDLSGINSNLRAGLRLIGIKDPNNPTNYKPPLDDSKVFPIDAYLSAHNVRLIHTQEDYAEMKRISVEKSVLVYQYSQQAEIWKQESQKFNDIMLPDGFVRYAVDSSNYRINISDLTWGKDCLGDNVFGVVNMTCIGSAEVGGSDLSIEERRIEELINKCTTASKNKSNAAPTRARDMETHK